MNDPITIPLSSGKSTLIDKDDLERVSRFRWHVMKTAMGGWYARHTAGTRGCYKGILLHRFIMNAATTGQEVDHINHDTLDNRKVNLRLCSHSENLHNFKRHKTNTSGFIGISRDYRRWVAQISIDKRRITVGRFSNKEDAARAYDAAAIKHYGKYATVNFPQTKRKGQ